MRDVQGPLTFLQCNLAGNARPLLTLLLFANSLHYSYSLNCIWFHRFAQRKKHPQCIVHLTPVVDSLGWDYHVQRVVFIYDTALCLSKHTATSSVTVTTFIWLTFKVRLLDCASELVTFISSLRQSVVLNDKSRAHIVKVEAFYYPCGCPRRKANCSSALFSTFGPVLSRALVSQFISSKQPQAP